VTAMLSTNFQIRVQSPCTSCVLTLWHPQVDLDTQQSSCYQRLSWRQMYQTIRSHHIPDWSVLAEYSLHTFMKGSGVSITQVVDFCVEYKHAQAPLMTHTILQLDPDQIHRPSPSTSQSITTCPVRVCASQHDCSSRGW